MERAESGHRAVPHTADLRIEAWAPTRERCIAEAAHGMVESYVDTSAAAQPVPRELHLEADSDADLLAAVLDEVIYRMETAGEIPVAVTVSAAGAGVDVCFHVVDVDAVPLIGAVPKAVSLNDLRLAPGPHGWECSVTLDV